MKLITPIAFDCLNPLSPIDNLLHVVVRNRFGAQVYGNTHTYKNYYYLLTYFYIYPHVSVFYPLFHAHVSRVRAGGNRF
jgi:hypothetical protein